MKEAAPVSKAMTKKTQPNVLQLEGEIDLHVSPEVAESLRTMIAKKPTTVVVDLAKVTYLDSSGLAVLIEGMQNVREYGGNSASPKVKETVNTFFNPPAPNKSSKISPT